jgi:hypothetical protein
MHRRAREHVGVVIKRKIMRRQRRIISSITGGWRNYSRWSICKMLLLYHGKFLSEEDIYYERTFRPDHPKVTSNKE